MSKVICDAPSWNSPQHQQSIKVRQLGDPWLTETQAQIVLALYDSKAGPLPWHSIERAIHGYSNESGRNLVKVHISNIRSRLSSAVVVNRWGYGYELSSAFRAQLDALLSQPVAA